MRESSVCITWLISLVRVLVFILEDLSYLMYITYKSQHWSRLHKYVNGFFSSENIYVSFIGAKAKTRVTGSLGRNWARLVLMDGLVPFDPPHENTSAHAGMIK